MSLFHLQEQELWNLDIFPVIANPCLVPRIEAFDVRPVAAPLKVVELERVHPVASAVTVLRVDIGVALRAAADRFQHARWQPVLVLAPLSNAGFRSSDWILRHRISDRGLGAWSHGVLPGRCDCPGFPV